VSAAIKCGRCSRRFRGSGEWNLTMRQGLVVGVLCPGCQTPEENTEAAINEATLEYGTNSDGRLVARPRVGGDR
jgi:hypothetical protein